jgi:hypothetical protein
MKRHLAFVAIVTVALTACSDPLEFADWTIPVPEGTQTVEYGHVPHEERVQRIELVEELVIGGGADSPAYFLYRPRGVAVDDDGRIYVADYGDHQVKVYDKAGTHLRSLGREGQGPGEFTGPGYLTVAGSLLVVNNNGRLSYWDLEGNHVGDLVVGANMPLTMAGLHDGTFVVRYPILDDERRQFAVPARWDTEGEELTRYPPLGDPPPIFYPSREAEVRIGLSVAPAVPAVATDPTGRIYTTPSDRYQVFAFDAKGKMVLSLRVAYPARPVSRDEIERAMDVVRQRFPEAAEGTLDWPKNEPALTKILVDGHGHLYVFPYVPAGLEPEERPVDVYGKDGERLFTGLIASKIWLWADRFVAHGDFVYDVRQNGDTGENEVVRFRLVEPFR